MDRKDIVKEIVRLKMLKPQTQQIKLKIQKLQQKLEMKRFYRSKSNRILSVYVGLENILIQIHCYGGYYLLYYSLSVTNFFIIYYNNINYKINII